MSKVWFITGSAGGIGAGIARAALTAGDVVVATDLDLERLQQVYAANTARAWAWALSTRSLRTHLKKSAAPTSGAPSPIPGPGQRRCSNPAITTRWAPPTNWAVP